MTRSIALFGATSAVAGEVARRLAARGDRLFLAGRSPEKLAALVAVLGDAVAGHCVVDFTEPEAARRAVDAACATLGALDVALIAHGLLGDQASTEHDFEHADEILRTNLDSVVALLVPLANAFEARGGGHLAVITSVAGERGRPRNYTYGAAKAALNTYLQGLRSRLWPRGVQVHTIKLGPVDSPMTETHSKHMLFSTPAAVAETIVHLLDGPGGEHYVPGWWRPILGLVRVLPEALFQRFGFLAGR